MGQVGVRNQKSQRSTSAPATFYHCCCSTKLVTWEGGLQAPCIPLWQTHLPCQVWSKHDRCRSCCRFLGPLQNAALSVGSMSSWLMRYTIPLPSNVSHLTSLKILYFIETLEFIKSNLFCTFGNWDLGNLSDYLQMSCKTELHVGHQMDPPWSPWILLLCHFH